MEHRRVIGEREHEILRSYDVRTTYSKVFAELDEVYVKREELWGYAGFEHGTIYNIPPFISELEKNEIMEIDEDTPKRSNSMFEVRMVAADKLIVKLETKSYRLNFHPGAIISAAQKAGSSIGSERSGSVCCFGYEKEYEGTALQLAFDPHIAVLEPLDNEGRKKTGFQMLFLGTTGLHAYGNLYRGNGHCIDRMSTELIRDISMIELSVKDPDNHLDVDVATALCRITSMANAWTVHLATCLHQRTDITPGQLVCCDEDVFDLEEWTPLAGRNKSSHWDEYGEQIENEHDSIFMCYMDSRISGTGNWKAKEIYRPFSTREVHELVEKTHLFSSWKKCPNCGEILTRKDREEVRYTIGESLGLEGIYCSLQCAIESAHYHCTKSMAVGDETVSLVNGKMVIIPAVAERRCRPRQAEGGEESGHQSAA
ncbi:MAG: hypothetical protein FWD27_00580 [Coriobacteriia bacterium]|nr:hypothetical protein [Coriobacteriia bacterium]